MCIPIHPSAAGSLPARNPSGKGVGPMRTSTLVIIGAIVGAVGAQALKAPFPAPGANPSLDLVALHDPGLHALVRVWYYAWPAVLVVLAGSLALSVWRVWFQPLFRFRRRGRLPDWPTSPEDDAPSLVVGELHHPTVPRESDRPAWLVIPEKGLYTGMLVVGAVGTGKTTACMYPFARQLLSWRARRCPQARGRARAGGQGRLLPSGPEHPGRGGPRGRLPGDRARRVAPVEPARRSATRFLLDGLRRGVAHQPALRQIARTVLAAGVHEPRALDRRTPPAPAGGLGHAPGPSTAARWTRSCSRPGSRRPGRWRTGSLQWMP